MAASLSRMKIHFPKSAYFENPLQSGAIGLINSAIALAHPAGLVELVTAIRDYRPKDFGGNRKHLNLLKREALRLLDNAERTGAIKYYSKNPLQRFLNLFKLNVEHGN